MSLPTIYAWRKRGAPVEDGDDAIRSWLVEQRRLAPQAGHPRRRRSKRGVAEIAGDGAAAGDAGADQEDRPRDVARTAEVEAANLEHLYAKLPAELKKLNPKDAYEWLRCMKLTAALDQAAAEQVSKQQALDMLTDRARALRQTMLTVPRRVQHLLSEEAFSTLTAEIRRALEVYAAPEGYLDRLLPAEVLAEAEPT